MRTLLAAFLLLAPALAGCIAVEPVDPAATLTPNAIAMTVPDGATLIRETDRAILEWANVSFPFTTTVTIPEGATLVRGIGIVDADLPVSVSMRNADTGRRRCNTDVVDAWNLPVRGVSTCSGIAAIDPPGAKWDVSASARGPGLGIVRVEFGTMPLDGLVGTLDLTQLSMPTFDLEPTRYLKVPSFDGTPLHVEVTLPVGEGPWPTVIAASPYNGQYDRGQTPAMWTYFTQDWAKRGYAIVNVDVRGFGESGGCVEVWGTNEQLDQEFIVNWVAEQTWSDGAAGFYGQSYVATTPVAAAVRAPEALKAIIAVAPVMDAYYDWHYGGVPNGENAASPVAYQMLVDVPPGPMTTDPAKLVANNAKGACDPTLVARSSDPRAIYDAFYEERNFSKGAADVKAAVLYTQGFEDSNVKSAMIPNWFNAITAPKLGLFGHWVHQHPTRADEEILFLGWMDQFVKGRNLGLGNVSHAEVVVDADTMRTTPAWPPVDATITELAMNFQTGTLGGEAGESAGFVLDPTGELDQKLVLTLDVAEDFGAAGTMTVNVVGTLMGAENAYLTAELYDGADLITYGMFNVAHRNGHHRYDPVTATERLTFAIPFLPTEHIFRAGDTMRVVLRATQPADHGLTLPGEAGLFTFSGETVLAIPTIDMGEYMPVAATATP